MRMLCNRSPRIDSLERRVLFAVKTVDFNNFPVNFTQLNYLLQDVHTPTSGFNYTIGTGDGQRPNINGVTWADQTYYDSVLGSTGGFNSVNAWNMKPILVYTGEKSGGWLSQGWNYVPDMVEGDACVDDAARAATTAATDYILNGTQSSYQTARDILTFVSYMTTRQGSTYNFAWLDPSTLYSYDPIYSQQAHFGYRVEYYKRTGYPSASPSSSWGDPNSTTSQIINYPNPVRASPFLTQPKYSVYMNDLRDASGNNVATVYSGPLYTTASGGPTSYKTGIVQTNTTSTQAYGDDEARSLQAVATGLLMMQKRQAQEGGTLTADETAFTQFLENEWNRLYNNTIRQNITGFDSKLASYVLPAMDDYYQLYYGTDQYGTFSFKLPANSNTSETTDDRPSQSMMSIYIQQLASSIESKQVRSSTYMNGIFSDDGTGQNWQAYDNLQMFALARTYRMEVNIGNDPNASYISTMLDDAAYAADNYYGIEAYHYDAPGTNNVRTKERITQIVNGGALYHTNSTQIAYDNSSIVAGLRELAMAYQVSGRSDAATRSAGYFNDMKSVASWFIGNNNSLLDMYDGGQTLSGTYRGRGSVFDGISATNNITSINRNTGGESLDEGLWAVILAKAAIRDNNLDSTFSFETGASTAAAPIITATNYDYAAAQPALRFSFSQEVGASLHATDFIITNTTTGQVIPTANLVLAYNVSARQLSITFPSYVGGALPDGNYSVLVHSYGVVGNAGNPMAADSTSSFFSLAGDANHDGKVDIADLGILASDYGLSNSFTGGDFNYDGLVNIADLGILATNYGKNLNPSSAELPMSHIQSASQSSSPHKTETVDTIATEVLS